MRTLTATVAALSLAADAVPAAAASQAGPPDTDGVWRMDGYGTVLVLGGGALQEYQTTSVSCVKGDTSPQTGPGTYATTDGSVLTVRTGHDRDHALLAADSSVGHRRLHRLNALPAGCARPAATDPRSAFDVFWQTFEENYPDRRSGQVRPGTHMPGPGLDASVKKFIEARDLNDASHRQDFGSGRITYADLPGDLGYLRISGFGGYAGEHAPYTAEQAELDRALNTVLTPGRTERLQGLVIDLRVNGGGHDSLGVRIALKLTFIVDTWVSDHYGDPHAEVHSHRPGRTVRIGQPTQGVFSDVMDRYLPDGLVFGLPDEEYLTRTEGTFDGTGIPPQLIEPVFTKEEFAKMRDSAFDRAVNLLSGRG
ncbi:S41 family peptidase [Streptomyces roseochromogenus]|uniref:Tail specific protease domain-containing protein n=1 Tax=Streptomyces roseochromogenus subsp. oscitans DS 12.976 TaxID=1352936 RepID=V6KVR9_STRRC|nr:S41 family peptidase [Streptomyces roseochromogenus]EST36212.1 hypothetical protein M878_02980 [Streptomyces roseochromogenus subsp. oscitans DS 12.976]